MSRRRSSKLGGTLSHIDHLRVRALPDHLPELIELPIDALVDFDALVHVRDLAIPDDVTLLTDLDEVAARVLPPRIEEVVEVVPTEGAEEEGGEAEAASPAGEAGAEERRTEPTDGRGRDRPAGFSGTRRVGGGPAYPPVVDLRLPFQPPVEPMLAKPADELPAGDGWLFEPKWDGFRALVFRDGDEVYTQSRDLKPLDRYFPELAAPLRAHLPERCVLDGEIVIAGPEGGLEFEALLLRIHPAASRVALLAAETPASFVAWDLLALGDEDLRADAPGRTTGPPRGRPLAGAAAPIHLTPATRDRATRGRLVRSVRGRRPRRRRREAARRAVPAGQAGDAQDQAPADRRLRRRRLPLAQGRPGHARSARSCSACSTTTGTLHHVGVTSSFTMERRAELVGFLEPYRMTALDGHPWAEWAEWAAAFEAAGQRLPGATSRWNRGKDLSWEALRPELVCEVAFDHLQGDRFRHAATFLRWRPDRDPASCRYDQLAETPAYELARIFGA